MTALGPEGRFFSVNTSSIGAASRQVCGTQGDHPLPDPSASLASRDAMKPGEVQDVPLFLLADQERTVYQRRGLVRLCSGVYDAKRLHSDLPAGLPEFEHPLSGYDLPRLVEQKLPVSRGADCPPDGIFALVMSNSANGVAQTRFWKAGHKPYFHRGSDRSAGENVTQSESQRFSCRNGSRALKKGDILNFRDRAEVTMSTR